MKESRCEGNRELNQEVPLTAATKPPFFTTRPSLPPRF